MQALELRNGGPSSWLAERFDLDHLDWVHNKLPEISELDLFFWLAGAKPVAGASGSYSNYAETHILDHSNGKTSWTMPATIALALCTTTPDSSKTGATIVEANYTGYARATVAAASFAAAVSGGAGAASTVATSATITFANCTAGSSTIIGWALCDSATTAAGNMIWWGSATSTVISTTQTPATIASGGLTESLT